jgi:hypothetical protein
MDYEEGVPGQFPLPDPGTLVPGAAQVSTDELQRQRQAELQAAADKYAHEQKLTDVARRRWENQRERSHLNLMAQLPKLIGAACAGALLAYVIPLGSDR